MVELKFIENYEEVNGVEWDNRHNAPETQVGIAYMTLVDYKAFFRFCPSEDGYYILTTSGKGQIYDFTGEQIGKTCSSYSSIKIKLEGNKVYFLKIIVIGININEITNVMKNAKHILTSEKELKHKLKEKCTELGIIWNSSTMQWELKEEPKNEVNDEKVSDNSELAQ